MKKKGRPSPIARLWGWAEPYHGSFVFSVALAIAGVACGMVPYFCIARLITGLLAGERAPAFYAVWCGGVPAGYLGKVLFASLSTSISHTATYHTLRGLRRSLVQKAGPGPHGHHSGHPFGAV